MHCCGNTYWHLHEELVGDASLEGETWMCYRPTLLEDGDGDRPGRGKKEEERKVKVLEEFWMYFYDRCLKKNVWKKFGNNLLSCGKNSDFVLKKIFERFFVVSFGSDELRRRHTYKHTYILIHTSYIKIHACIHTCLHSYIHIHTSSWHIGVHSNINICILAHTYVYIRPT